MLISPLALLAKVLRPGVKNVMFAHGIEVWDDPQFARVSKLNRFAVRNGIDQILRSAALPQSASSGVFGVADDVLQIFPNAVDVTEHYQGRPKSAEKAAKRADSDGRPAG